MDSVVVGIDVANGTDGLESVVAAGLTATGLTVVVVNPAPVRAFAQAHQSR